MYGVKIRALREWRGYSQENLAAKLGLTQPQYSRIETNQTKLDAAMLERLAKELGVSPADIMSGEPIVVNFFGTNNGSQGNFGTIENLYAGQKELYEKIILGRDEEIAHLKKIIESLLPKK